MTDSTVLAAALKAVYQPITADSVGQCVFVAGDAIRLMAAHQWDRPRVCQALRELVHDGLVRSCPVRGFGGNVHVYGLTTAA